MADDYKRREATCPRCGISFDFILVRSRADFSQEGGGIRVTCPDPRCRVSFTVHIEDAQFEGRVEGVSSKEVSDVVRSILESRPGHSITVTGSTIGIINTGKIKEIQDIAMNLKTINDAGNEEVATAIKELTAAIAESSELDAESREDCLAHLHELSKQAALPKEARSNRSIIRSILSGLATTLGASGGLAETWTMWGPAIKGFFGL